MATVTLGTNATTTLTALAFSYSNAAADTATIDQSILDDQLLLNAGVTFTATTNSTATLGTFSAGALAKIQKGYYIIGSGIPVGTVVASKGATTLVLSAAATASASAVKMIAIPTTYPGAFARMGLLYVPNRGVLKVLPGDYVGVDASGWPILVSAEAIAYTGTSWSHS
jgi:hypothetical protein